MKIIALDDLGFPIIANVTSLRVGKRGRWSDPFDKNDCQIDGKGVDSTVMYTIISSDRHENGVYKGLTEKEAILILETAVNSDVIDLRKLGNFHLFGSGSIKTVFVQNAWDEWEDKEVPLLVKVLKDEENQ